MSGIREPAIWFPTVRTGTGTDVFTERLVDGLAKRGIRTEIAWLPLRAEYAPWTVPAPKPPEWATVVHVNTWLRSRFTPGGLSVVATIHHAMHDPAIRAYKGFARSMYHRYWIAPNERRVLRRADCVTAVSRFVATTARQALLDVPMDVIYNGVDTARFRPGNRQRNPHEPFRLLYVGSWKRLKGVSLLAPIMRELGNGFELRYTGGPAAKRDKARMPANMHDIGRLHGEDAVVSAMRNADALLLPSRSEGHPLVAVEAMGCGLPIAAARGSSLQEAIENGVNGTLCEQDNVAAFVAACRAFASTPSQWASMADAARARAVSDFSSRHMVEAYVGIYRRAMERAGQRCAAKTPRPRA